MNANTKHTPGLEAPQPWRDWINGLRADLADMEREILGVRAENARLREALEKAQQIADSIRYDRHMNIRGARTVANALHAEARAALGAK